MFPQSSAAINNFTAYNYSNEHHLIHTEMTLDQKLGVIKRCIEEKQFSNHYNDTHDLKSRFTKNNKSGVRSCLVKELNFGVNKIVKKISNVILNKQILALSTSELNSLIKLTGQSKEAVKKNDIAHAPKLVGFLSVFSDTKVSDSFRTIGYDRNRHHKRKTFRTFSRYGYVNSLALYVERLY